MPDTFFPDADTMFAKLNGSEGADVGTALPDADTMFAKLSGMEPEEEKPKIGFAERLKLNVQADTGEKVGLGGALLANAPFRGVKRQEEFTKDVNLFKKLQQLQKSGEPLLTRPDRMRSARNGIWDVHDPAWHNNWTEYDQSLLVNDFAQYSDLGKKITESFAADPRAAAAKTPIEQRKAFQEYATEMTKSVLGSRLMQKKEAKKELETRDHSTVGSKILGAGIENIGYQVEFMTGPILAFEAARRKKKAELTRDELKIDPDGEIFMESEGDTPFLADLKSSVMALATVRIEQKGGELIGGLVNASLRKMLSVFGGKKVIEALSRGAAGKVLKTFIRLGEITGIGSYPAEIIEEVEESIVSEGFGIGLRESEKDGKAVRRTAQTIKDFPYVDTALGLLLPISGQSTLAGASTYKRSVDNKKHQNSVLKLFGGVSDADLAKMSDRDRAFLAKRIGDTITPEMADRMLRRMDERGQAVLKKITENNGYAFEAEEQGIAPTFRFGQPNSAGGYFDEASGLGIIPENGKYRTVKEAVTAAEQLSAGNVVKDNVREKKAQYAAATANRLAPGVATQIFYSEADMLAEMPDIGKLPGYKPGDAMGFLRDGQMVLVLDNIGKPSDVVLTVLHEAGVHEGLRRVLGDQETLDKTLALLPKEYRQQAARLQAASGYSTEQATEEALAVAWESRKADPSAYQRIVAGLHDAVRKVVPKVPFTESDIEVLMSEAQQSVTTGLRSIRTAPSVTTGAGEAVRDATIRMQEGERAARQSAEDELSAPVEPQTQGDDEGLPAFGEPTHDSGQSVEAGQPAEKESIPVASKAEAEAQAAEMTPYEGRTTADAEQDFASKQDGQYHADMVSYVKASWDKAKEDGDSGLIEVDGGGALLNTKPAVPGFYPAGSNPVSIDSVWSQRKGAGREVMFEAARQAVALNRPMAWSKPEPGAMGFYRKLGFKPVDRIGNFFVSVAQLRDFLSAQETPAAPPVSSQAPAAEKPATPAAGGKAAMPAKRRGKPNSPLVEQLKQQSFKGFFAAHPGQFALLEYWYQNGKSLFARPKANSGGEYDAFRDLPLSLQNVITGRRPTDTPIDVVAQQIAGTPTLPNVDQSDTGATGELVTEIVRQYNAYKKWKEGGAQSQEDMESDWYEGQARLALHKPQTVDAQDMVVGDLVKRDGEWHAVKKEAGGDVTILQDGYKYEVAGEVDTQAYLRPGDAGYELALEEYRVQEVKIREERKRQWEEQEKELGIRTAMDEEDYRALYPEEFDDEDEFDDEASASKDKETTAKDAGKPDLTLEQQTPDDVVTERKRLEEAEKARKARDEIARLAAAPITGTAGDLTADLFGEQEGETPLFNARRDTPAKPSAEAMQKEAQAPREAPSGKWKRLGKIKFDGKVWDVYSTEDQKAPYKLVRGNITARLLRGSGTNGKLFYEGFGSAQGSFTAFDNEGVLKIKDGRLDLNNRMPAIISMASRLDAALSRIVSDRKSRPTEDIFQDMATAREMASEARRYEKDGYSTEQLEGLIEYYRKQLLTEDAENAASAIFGKQQAPAAPQETANVKPDAPAKPSAEAMQKEAQRWQGAHMNAEKMLLDAGDRKGAMAVATSSGKSNLDDYLIKKFGVDRATAHEVSNTLTQSNMPADRTAKVKDFAGEVWADAAIKSQVSSPTAPTAPPYRDGADTQAAQAPGEALSISVGSTVRHANDSRKTAVVEAMTSGGASARIKWQDGTTSKVQTKLLTLAEPQAPKKTIGEVAAEYGYSVNDSGDISTPSGKDTGAAIGPPTGGRYRVRNKSTGKMLFSFPSSNTAAFGEFLEQYWYAKKVEQQAPAAPQETIAGTRAVAQRIVNAENAFIDFAMRTAGLTKPEAEAALAAYRKAKAIKIDPIGGSFSLTHGGFAEVDVLRRAAGREEAPAAAPKPDVPDPEKKPNPAEKSFARVLSENIRSIIPQQQKYEKFFGKSTWKAQKNRLIDGNDVLGGFSKERHAGGNTAWVKPAIAKATSSEDLIRIADKLDALVAKDTVSKESPTVKSPVANLTPEESARAEDLKARLRKMRGRANMGLDPEFITVGAELTSIYIKGGIRTFKQYAAVMKQELGDIWDNIKNDLRGLWEYAAADNPDINEVTRSEAAAVIAGLDNQGPQVDNNHESEAANEPDTAGSMAESGRQAETPLVVGGSDVQPGGRGTGAGDSAGGQRGIAGIGRAGNGDLGLPDDSAANAGSPGDLDLFGNAPAVPGRPAGSAEPAGSRRAGEARMADDGAAGDQSIPDPSPRDDGGDQPLVDSGNPKVRRSAQAAADRIGVVRGNAVNIRKTLPLLLKSQQRDVLLAEQRFAKPDGYGMMFTNGTGTGKTYSGMGIVKRYVQEGRDNILVVAPSQEVIAGWIKAAKDLGIPISQLGNRSSNGGKGVVITTYANMGKNDSLAKRSWDLVVADESQNLLSKADSDVVTLAGEALRAITMHHRGTIRLSQMLHPQIYDRVREAQAAWKLTKTAEADAAYTAASRAVTNAERDTADQVTKNQGEKRPRVVFLSATPFAYVKNIDYAEGYLFDYGPETQGGGYNEPSAQQRYLMTNFGYQMRYGKLQAPDASVNSDVMEREWNTMMFKNGALSGRRIDIESDYERRFALTEDSIGTEIDNGMKFLNDADDGRFRPLYKYVNDKFDYLSRMYLLEALKAKHAVPIIKKWLKQGHKVVVFHDFNKGGGFNPFLFENMPRKVSVYDWKKREQVEVETGPLIAEFFARNPAIAALDFTDLDSPINTIMREFPTAGQINGTRSSKQIAEDMARFNSDESGPSVVIVQAQKGGAGISLHDTTGKHPRREINLGLPSRPVTAIQEEGRIYRVGQHPGSNAMFLYMNTGTNWEAWAFARKMFERGATAENLAMGEQARRLRQSYVEGFRDSTVYDPSPADGKGGKAHDAAVDAISDYDRAKSYYYGRQKKNARSKSSEGRDYFATPEPLGLKMVEWSGVKSGESILEPSAGHGAISRFFPETSANTIIEPSAELYTQAVLVGNASTKSVKDTFENHDIHNKYDAITMNPPFGVGGKTAVEHIAKAFTHLRDGGRIVAILPQGGMANKRFNEWYDNAKGAVLIRSVGLPQITFGRAGTSVKTRVVIIDKYTSEQDVAKASAEAMSPTEIESDTANELFDEIENLGVPERIKVEKKPVGVSLTSSRDAVLSSQPQAGSADVKPDIVKSWHTKKGIDIFILKPKAYMAEAKYINVAAAAKRAGGWYSRKWDTSPAGFAFETQEAAEAFAAAHADVFTPAPTVRFRRASDAEYLAAVEAGDEATAQRMVYEAARGAGEYTVTDMWRSERGTDKAFTVFNKEKIGQEQSFGYGFYFGPNKDFINEYYGGNARRFILSMKNPFTGNAQQLLDILSAQGFKVSAADRAWFAGKGVRSVFKEFDTYRVTQALKKAGYDGARQSGELVVWEPNQIKSGDAVTRYTADDAAVKEGRAKVGDPIPLSERFNAGNDDTRFRRASDAEYLAVVEAYTNKDGSKKAGWMLAPNGKPTKLQERQWVQVRTPAFKAWFGDWEKFASVPGGVWADSQGEVSKVVDENGEPLVVYHGTPQNFSAFDPARRGENTKAQDAKKGFFFTASGEAASEFTWRRGEQSGVVMPVYLSLRDPIIIDMPGEWMPGKFDPIIDRAKQEGRDGVIMRGTTTLGKTGDYYIAFEPTQIKSAIGNRGTFDTENPDIRFRRVTDKAALDRLESDEKIKAYAAMQLVDGNLVSPMAAKINGKWVNPMDIGAWYVADENPGIAFEQNGRWYFRLNKGNGSSIAARYNPYFHSSASPLNDQFLSASSRDNLVTVEVEVPVSDIESGYKADKAKDAVGEHTWKAGPVARLLPEDKERKVFLSQYRKVIRVVPDSEVAEKIAALLEGEDITIPDNVVTPSLKSELVKLGVPVGDSDTRFRRASDAEYLAAVDAGDEASAQKMVDKVAKTAGLVEAWHGTDSEFHVFNPDFSHTGSGAVGWFATDKKFADLFGNNVRRFYLNTGRVLDLRKTHRDGMSVDDWKSVLSKLGVEGIEFDEDALFNSVVRNGKVKFHDLMPNKGNELSEDHSNLSSVLSNKFDSVLYPDERTGNGKNKFNILMFNSASIKSADAVTRDDAGRVIPPSERFNAGNDDTRFRSKRDLEALGMSDKPRRAVGIKNADIEAERELLNLDPLPDAERISNQQTLDTAMQIKAVDGMAAHRLVQEIIAAPRSLTPIEQGLFAVRHLDLDIERVQIEDAIATAFSRGNQADAVSGVERRKIIEAEIDALGQANKLAGTEMGRAFQLRKMMLLDDYSLAGMERRARADAGGELNDERRSEISKQYEALQKAYDALKAQLDTEADNKARANLGTDINRMKRDIKRMKRDGKETDADADAMHDKVLARIAFLAETAEWKDIPELPNMIRQLVRYHVGKNMDASLDEIVGLVHTDIVDMFPAGIRPRDVRDLYSRYGKVRLPSVEEVDVRMRELTAQAQKRSAIDDVLRRLAPLKTGYLRDEQSQEVRELTKQLHVLMKEYGIANFDPDRQQKTALDAIKTRLRNQVADLDKAINTETPLPDASAVGVAYDADATALKARRDALQAEYDAIFPPAPITEAERLEAATRSAERSLGEAEAKLEAAKRGEFADKLPPGYTPDAALLSIRARRDAINDEVKRLKELANPEMALEEAIRKRERQLQRSLDRYRDRLARGDFAPKPKAEPPMSAKAFTLAREVEKAKQAYEQGRKDWLIKQQGFKGQVKVAGKGLDNILRAFKSGYDVGMIGLQNAMLVGGHPIKAIEAFWTTMDTVLSDYQAYLVDQELRADPDYAEMVRMGKKFMSIDSDRSSMRPDEYQSSIAEKIPGVRASGRIYATFMNVMHLSMYKGMKNSGIFGAAGPTDANKKGIRFLIDVFGGRGDMGKFAVAGEAASHVFWSARMNLARIQTLIAAPLWAPSNTSSKYKLFVLTEYARSYAGIAAMTLVMRSLFGGDDDDVEAMLNNPASKLLFKVRVGNTTVDFTGGLADWVTFAYVIGSKSRMEMGGREVDLKNSFGASVDTEAMRMFRSKLAPTLGTIWNLISDENFLGEPYNLTSKEGLKNVAADLPPMALRDVYEAIAGNGAVKGMFLAPFILAGYGKSTYQLDTLQIKANRFSDWNKRRENAKTPEERQAINAERPDFYGRVDAIKAHIAQVSKTEREIRKMEKNLGAAPNKEWLKGQIEFKKQNLERQRKLALDFFAAGQK